MFYFFFYPNTKGYTVFSKMSMFSSSGCFLNLCGTHTPCGDRKKALCDWIALRWQPISCQRQREAHLS